MFVGVVSMRDLKIKNPKLVSFRHVDLSKVEFSGTDLHEIQFVAVKWNRQPRFRLWKLKWNRLDALYDEIRLKKRSHRNQNDIERLRLGYLQLKRNYEDKRDYRTADEFYFGEMEAKRLSIKNPMQRVLFSWQALYRWVSGYGTLWFNSLILIAMVFLVLPTVFPITALQYKALSGSVKASYLDALQYNFLVVTFQRDIDSHFAASFATRNIAIVESLLLPILATLFILALRRRFKR
jgi:hypothetical protein